MLTKKYINLGNCSTTIWLKSITSKHTNVYCFFLAIILGISISVAGESEDSFATNKNTVPTTQAD